jgi:hypothetical protein
VGRQIENKRKKKAYIEVHRDHRVEGKGKKQEMREERKKKTTQRKHPNDPTGIHRKRQRSSKRGYSSRPYNNKK